MPARNVIRPTLSGRFSNTPASNPATITAAQLNQGAPNATAQTGAGPVAATRSTPQGFQGTGYVSTVQIPRNVTFTTPGGAKGIIQLSSNGRAKITSNPQYTEPIKQNGKVIGTGTFDTAIVGGKLTSQIISFKGNTLTEPVNSTTNTSIGTLTEKGTINYQYALQGSKLVPEITSTQGGIFYQSPRMQQQYSKAEQAYSTAQSNLNEFHTLENVTIPSFAKQVNVAFSQGNTQYGLALVSELQSNMNFMNQLFFKPTYTKGEFANYDAPGLLSASQTAMNANKPVEVAKLTTSGLAPLATTVGDAIYGNVSGKNQQLGTLLFSPTVNNGTLSLAYKGFQPAQVQVSGQGWSAAINTSFNPNTGKISVNPKNYTYVTAYPQTETLPNGEVVKSIVMPSGFGLTQAFGLGALNYLSISNIPVTNGQYTATESYTSQGNSAFYTLTNPGGFPAVEGTTTYLGKGITESETYTRQFNPATGAISYTGSSGFSIPGVGSVPIPTSSALSEIYTYKGKQYTFNFNPANSDYSISLPPTARPASTTNASTDYIQYNFGTLGGVTGYTITNSAGQYVSGANYLTPKFVAGSNTVTQPTMEGNTLLLPMSSYLTYISNVNSNTKASEVNAALSTQYANIEASNAQLPFGLGKFFNKIGWNPGWNEIKGGELVSQGYYIQGLESAGIGLVEGIAPVAIVAAPVASLTNAGISVAAQAATNAATGKPITNNLLLAGSLGADFGSIFGATLPEGTSAINVAKAVGIKAVKMGAGFGAFNVFQNEFVLAFGGNPATSSGATGGISPRSQAQGATGKSQSSFSLLSNYTPSEYLNVGLSLSHRSSLEY